MVAKELKSDAVVGTISEECERTLFRIEQRRIEAWGELERVNAEELKTFKQLQQDLKLPNEYVYAIKNATGEVIVKRQKTKTEMANEERFYKMVGVE